MDINKNVVMEEDFILIYGLILVMIVSQKLKLMLE